MPDKVHIIGGGLAGSEAAWQLAEAGVKVRLSEMRGAGDITPAHHTDSLAELVCSNSFRSDDAENNAVGLLHAEMRSLGSLIMAAADAEIYQPMNVNFGLFPPVEGRSKKAERKKIYTERARRDLVAWLPG